MATNLALYNLIRKGALQRGAGARVADYVATQAMYESKDGTSNVAMKNSNYSGIKYTGRKTQKAAKGLQSPEGNYYAKYPSIGAWLDDYIRILKMGPGKPFSNAKNMQDYVTRLKLNRYFTDTAGNYLANMKAVYNRYNNDPNVVKAQQKPPDLLAPKNTIRKANEKTQARNQAQEEVRTGTYKDMRKDHADSKHWSLNKWFDGLSSLNKALVIGAAGYLASRILDR